MQGVQTFWQEGRIISDIVSGAEKGLLLKFEWTPLQ